MSKAVMISIQPKWCEKIANGNKTIEIRKTRPKLEAPFKCYIYCTKPIHFYKISECMCTSYEYLHLCEGQVTMGDGFELYDKEYQVLNGRVIGEFICNSISEHEAEFHAGNDFYQDIREIFRDPDNPDDDCRDYSILTSNDDDDPNDCEFCKQTCLTFEEVKAYIGEECFCKTFYGWHISDLVIYDKPKELSEFKKPCICTDEYEGETYCNCLHCDLAGDSDYGIIPCDRKLTRPPQSWRYAEECNGA